VAKQEWIDAKLFFHGDLNTLLTQLLHPMVRDLHAEGLQEGCHFIRHWNGGPHVRLRLRTSPGSRGSLERALSERSSAFFRTRPSPTVWHNRDYMRAVRRFAALEGATRILSLSPNNTIEFAQSAEPRPQIDAASLRALEDHYVQASDIAWETIESYPTLRLRRLVAFSWILSAHLVLRHEGVPHSILSPFWRRELKAMDGSPGRMISAQGRGDDRLRGLASAVCEHLATGTPSVALPGMDDWLRSYRVVVRDVRPHKESPSAELLDHCVHLQCNRMGLPLIDEARTRLIASRIAESIGGVP
jgi:hypothetical protein